MNTVNVAHVRPSEASRHLLGVLCVSENLVGLKSALQGLFDLEADERVDSTARPGIPGLHSSAEAVIPLLQEAIMAGLEREAERLASIYAAAEVAA
jgi:hypothetical protein